MNAALKNLLWQGFLNNNIKGEITLSNKKIYK